MAVPLMVADISVVQTLDQLFKSCAAGWFFGTATTCGNELQEYRELKCPEWLWNTLIFLNRAVIVGRIDKKLSQIMGLLAK